MPGHLPPAERVHGKVKILKSPKFDVTKLMEVHGDYSGEEVGAKVSAPPRRRRRRRRKQFAVSWVLTSNQSKL